jgi:nucleoside-triphosphatase
VTGIPGSGKTTVVLKTAERLKEKGYSIGGMLSRDVRSYGNRIGFEILNLNNGRKGWLASIHQKQGPQIGKHRVNIDDIDKIGVQAITEANESLDAVVIDEIGPMELFSGQFREAVKRIVEGRKLVVCTIHWRMTDSLLEDLRKREDAETYVVTVENRTRLHEAIVLKALDFLEARS